MLRLSFRCVFQKVFILVSLLLKIKINASRLTGNRPELQLPRSNVFKYLNAVSDVCVVRCKWGIDHLWVVNVQFCSAAVFQICHYHFLPPSVLSVRLAVHFFLPSSFQKCTQRTPSTHLKGCLLIIFTQLELCFDEHTNEHSPHAGPPLDLCQSPYGLVLGLYGRAGGGRRGWYLYLCRRHHFPIINTITGARPISF